MTQMPETPDQTDRAAPKKGRTREDRLKAALKANMGRRKAQVKARGDGATDHVDDRQQDNE